MSVDTKMRLITGDSFVPRTLSGSNEWYTPPIYVEAARRVMHGIELDPASCETANQIVQAECYYTQEDDGLSKPWVARSAFVNPPYGRGKDGRSNQDIWTNKLIAEYERGNLLQAVLLVNACTGTAVVQRLIQTYALCFVKGRIRFISQGRSEQGPTHDNLFAYFGPDEERFIDVFSRFGKCIPSFSRKTQCVTLTLWDEEEASL